MDKKELLNHLSECKKDKTILKGIVKLVQSNVEKENEELVIDYEGIKCIIPGNMVDNEFNFKSLISFIGTEVSFIVKDINKKDEIIIGSRADAQKITKPQIIEKLNDGECFDAKIINILPYGAYVDIEGVTGLLKNVDFAEDYTAIKEIKHVGDKVKVKLRGYSSKNNLLFEAVTKYISPTAITKDSLNVGDVVLGVVRNKQPWGIFVNVAPGLDALVDSEFVEVEEDQKVTVRIKSIKQGEDKLKVRGKIISVL